MKLALKREADPGLLAGALQVCPNTLTLKSWSKDGQILPVRLFLLGFGLRKPDPRRAGTTSSLP